MTKRAVWTVCFIIALLGAASVAYRVAKVTHFDSTEWREADENSEFLQRRAMMPEVEILFVGGKLSDTKSVTKVFGNPERTADDDPNTWYYNLGGENSSAAPDSITWLELKFDETGRLSGHRVMQELIVPPRPGEGG